MAHTNAPEAISPATLTPAQIPSQIDLLISLHLHLWSALTLAVQNVWGTASPEISNDKRDWLAGAISDLFAQNQLRDTEDLEDVLEQVMNDEFEVVVDDGTLEEVAHKIWKGVIRVRSGDGSEIQELIREWEKRRDTKVNATAMQNDNADSGADDDDSDEGESEWNGFEDEPSTLGRPDVDMDDAPALLDTSNSKRAEPEVDEDGFTKVVGKKKKK